MRIVLIDDEKFIHLSWSIFLKKQEHTLYPFFTVDDFLKESSKFSRDDVVCIDYYLSEGLKGDIEAKRIYSAGFENIYLCTSLESDEIQCPAWIKAQSSKLPNEFLELYFRE